MKINSLKSYFTLILLGAMLVPALVIGTTTYLELDKTIRHHAVQTVGNVADLRHAQLRQRLHLIRQRMQAWLVATTAKCDTHADCYREAMQTQMLSEGAVGMTLFSPMEETLSVGEAAPASLRQEPLQEGQVGKLPAYSPGVPRHLTVLLDTDTVRVAVVYPMETIQSLFTSHPDLGQSGENFLADPEGYFATRARYPSKQGRSHPINATPMRRCLSPENGETLDLDYRNVAIIHGFRYVKEIGGGCIMAHIDQEEAFLPLVRLQRLSLMAFFLIVIISWVVARLMGNYLTAPIMRIVAVAQAVREGNSTVLVEEHGFEEIVVLGKAFNAMTGRLLHINAELENLVAERTSELQAANERLQLLSTLDPLTGLANRRSFDHILEREYATLLRAAGPLSIIMMDIDHFKTFNDMYGHVAGDECLRQVGEVLRNLVHRNSDTVARYGGEEFAVILPATGPDGARQLAEQICAAIAGLAIPHGASSVADHVTASLGVATVLASPATSAMQVVEMADQQLYRAKSAGRNRVAVDEQKGDEQGRFS